MTAEIRAVLLCDAINCQEQVTSRTQNLLAVRAAAQDRLGWVTDGDHDFCPTHKHRYHRRTIV